MTICHSRFWRNRLPDWLRAMPAKAHSDIHGREVRTMKECPPFVDAVRLWRHDPAAMRRRHHAADWHHALDPVRGLSRRRLKMPRRILPDSIAALQPGRPYIKAGPVCLGSRPKSL